MIQVKELATSRATGDGTIYASKCRVHGIWVLGGATNGTVVLKNGGSGGSTVITIDVPGITTSGTTFAGYIQLPGAGLLFSTDCYVDLTTAAGVTVIYSPE